METYQLVQMKLTKTPDIFNDGQIGNSHVQLGCNSLVFGEHE